MTKLRFVSLCLAVLLVSAAAVPASAHDAPHGSIAVSDAWARATPPAARNGAVYATIRNDGAAPDRLIGIESGVAEGGEIHEMTMEGGVMQMRPLKDGLLVAPGATVELVAGRLHVMLVGLKRPLKAGETIRVTAIFEKAGRIEVAVPVVAMGAPAPAGHALQGEMNMQPGMTMPQDGSKP